MYYNGRYYATNRLHEASIQHAIETGQPQNRAQEISITLVRWILIGPAIAFLSVPFLFGAAYLLHLIGIG